LVPGKRVVESFLEQTWTLPLATAIKKAILTALRAVDVIYWEDVPSLHILYSRRRHEVVRHSAGLIGFAFFSRELLKAESASAHPSFSAEADGKVLGDVLVFLFPLGDSNKNIRGVVEVIGDRERPWNSDDEAFINFFTRKFRFYSRWLFQARRHTELVLELLPAMDLEQLLIIFQNKVCALFSCNSCELWRCNVPERVMTQYGRRVRTIGLAQ
jgi:hypothetical protein